MKLKTGDEIKVGDLRVWWIPQVPMDTPFYVDVPDLRTAKLMLDTLAAYDEFEFRHKVKPDYSNVGGLHAWDGLAEEWQEFEDIDGNTIDDINYDNE